MRKPLSVKIKDGMSAAAISTPARGQELGQFWAKLAVGNATLKKTSSNTGITDGNGNYSIAGAVYGVYSDKGCTEQLATLTTDNSGNTETVKVKAGTVYIKELSAPAGYKLDKTVYPLSVEAGKTATLSVSDTPKVTDTLPDYGRTVCGEQNP